MEYLWITSIRGGKATTLKIQLPFSLKRVKLCGITEEKVFECDALLNATGRVPNVFEVGLEKAGVEYNNRQGVVIDDYFRCEEGFDWLIPLRWTPDWLSRMEIEI